jgi:sortase A
MKKEKKKGYVWMLVGVLFLIAALLLTAYNIWDGKRAGDASEEIRQELIPQIGSEDEAGAIDPDMEIPTITINGNRYIGILEVPALNLSLPVMESWDYDKLRIAPCRYAGSPYKDNMVIAGHNYARHFSGLKNLPEGTEIQFVDVEGRIFRYWITDLEILKPNQTEALISGDWDLTLFTCTYGGGSRYTIRCTKESGGGVE